MKKKKEPQFESDFSFIASHELKAPLSAMKWFLNMLMKEDLGKLNPDQREILDEIYKNNEHMINLIESVTDAAAITKGTVYFKKTTFNLLRVLKDLEKDILHFAKAKNVALDLRIEKKDKLCVHGDKRRISDTIYNLLTNAVKYTPARGTVAVTAKKISRDELKNIIVKTTTHPEPRLIETSHAHEFVLFEVSDSGIGIPRDQQHRVFSKFFRGDNAIKINTRGVGLGLFIDRYVISMSDGFIWFRSSPEKGSLFAFALPLAHLAHHGT